MDRQGGRRMIWVTVWSPSYWAGHEPGQGVCSPVYCLFFSANALGAKGCVFCILSPWCPFWHKPDQQGTSSMTVVICPFQLWSMEKFSTDLFSSALVSGHDFSCTPPISTEGFQMPYRYYYGCGSMEGVSTVGVVQVSGVQHLAI